jgi:hypothetical protein
MLTHAHSAAPEGAPVPRTDEPVGIYCYGAAKRLATLQQVADEHPGLTVPTLRAWVNKAHLNGVDKCVVRIGRRLFIELNEFARWIDEHQGQRHA